MNSSVESIDSGARVEIIQIRKLKTAQFESYGVISMAHTM